ncbi:hypothetical protein KIW84_024366 [Lathyrus oleraceus]|nr:hypothetical protein KIW84_024366 [Pisum sativum]
MLGTRIMPNCFTLTSVVNACVGENGVVDCCPSLHVHVVKRGFDTSNFVISSLVDCYASCGRIDDAVLLFNETSEKDTVIYNTMISGYCRNLYNEDALKLFVEMRGKNMSPTDHTVSSILSACSRLAVLVEGKQVHSLVIKMGFENVFVDSTLINIYSKGGDIDEARRVLDQTSWKNTVLLTSMIMGYAQCGRGLEALGFLIIY